MTERSCPLLLFEVPGSQSLTVYVGFCDSAIAEPHRVG